MNDNNAYVNEFTKLQNIKNDLYNNNKQNQYSEDLNTFITTKFSLKKKSYINTGHQIEHLNNKLALLYINFLSMKQMYLSSRSNSFENQLKKLLDDIANTKQELSTLNKSLLFIDTSVTNSRAAPSTSTSKPLPSKMSPLKRKSLKKFLFQTYKQCISQKTTEPTYMSKIDIIKHIKEHDPALLKHLPKNISAMKKNDICKVIFP
jgi:hypothetical protein